MTEEDSQSSSEARDAFLKAQRARTEAYRDGEYELDEKEGFHCPDCEWEGLSAPFNIATLGENSEDEPIAECPECGGPLPLDDSGPDPIEYISEFADDYSVEELREVS